MTRAMSPGRLERTRREHAFAVFREWLERTNDPNEAARRAGVSVRTGRRWRATIACGGAGEAARVSPHEPQTSFVGRLREIEALHRVVRAGHRLIAILGVGGIGKTRVALRYSRLFGRELFAGGVYVAALAAATTADDVSRLVTEALGLTLDSDQPLAAALAERGPALLVLDDLDGSAERAAPLIAGWAAAAPAVTILMTARARPGVAGEAIFELDAMDVEPDGVDLFVERARLVRADFQPTADELRLAAAVVRKLEGIPLAIELAAARCGLLGLAELHVRLDARHAFLSAGTGHPSLLASIERSWRALGDADRRALAECTVFRGGFTLSAAEQVLTGDGIVDRIQVLRDHSLLRVVATNRRGEPRFDMYGSIRDVVGARLEDADTVCARHARFFLEHDPDPAELDNLRAVHERALAIQPVTPARVATALRALIAMHPLLARTGPLGEYRCALDATLVHAGVAGVDPALLARAFAARGRVMRGLGQPAEAEGDATWSLVLARSIDARGIEAQAHRDLGRIACNRGAPAEAKQHYEDARALFASCGDVRSEAHVLSLLSDIAHSESRDAEAVACGERAIELFARGGDLDSRARAMYVEGGMAFRAARYTNARRCWEQAIALFHELGDRRFEGYVQCNLGILLCEIARPHSARIHLTAAHELFTRSGYRRLAAIVLGYLGTLEHRLSNLDQARARYTEALATMGDAGGRYYAGVFGACLGSALAQLGRIADGRHELARAVELLDAHGDPKALLACELHGHVIELAASRSPAAVARAATALAELTPAHLISDDVRLARDLLARHAGAPTSARLGEPWWISEDGTAFRSPTTRLVDLRARRPLARLLAVLAQLRVDAPGVALTIDALFERGWPGERAVGIARVNRVNVALVTLRKLGLRPVLRRTKAGYLLDPEVAIELAPARGEDVRAPHADARRAAK